MAWQDRISDAAYTGPVSRTRITFAYENVRKSIEKTGAAFDFPDADGTFIQGSGTASRRFPLRVFFSGDDHDLEAAAFEALLLEPGTGTLEHPRYGTVDVVPFGPISQRDDLKTAANQSIIEVTFWATIGLLFPTSQQDPAASVLSAVDEYNVAAAQEFADLTSLDPAVEQATAKNTFTALLDQAKSGLQDIADTQADVQAQFNAINDSINNSIDVLIGQPLTLAAQTVLMIQAPARALTSILARLTAYGDLVTSIISVEQGGTPNSNDFHISDLYASTYVTGSVISSVNAQFVTKTDAVGAADEILQQFANVAAWRDDNYQELGEVDTGEAYQQLQEAVALAAGALVEISFSLKQERRITLTRPRTIIDLAAELYGTVDQDLDFLITSNNLSRSDILEIPRGREIVYYV